MPALSHRRALGLALTLALAVDGCGPRDAARGGVGAVATPTCPRLGDVVRELGATLRGRTSPFPLGAYFATGAIAVPAGGDAGCAGLVASGLEHLCTAARGGGACGSEGSFEACMVAVEELLDDPETCGRCGDGVCTAREQAWSLEEGGGAGGEGAWHPVCPEDCACGDGQCDPGRGETAYRCPLDCEVSCGDGLCDDPEVCGACDALPFPRSDCQRCDADCCATACGDGVCLLGAGETKDNCEQDCALGFCGDGVRLDTEDPHLCPVDGSAGMDHCLSARCREGWPCEDPREVCGDGVCMGCEMWTCAADCAQTGHPVCALGREPCPAGTCGDGVCASTAENPMTCPLDCPFTVPVAGDGVCDILEGLMGDPAECAGPAAARWCGDGVCNTWETAAACPADCGPADPICATSGVCAADHQRCAKVDATGLLTGKVERRDAVVSCDGDCAVVAVCADACVQDGARTRCVDCSWTNGELAAAAAPGACAVDSAPRCATASALSRCDPDPGSPDVAACAVRRSVICADGCDGDRCRPCPATEQCPSGGHCDPASGACVGEARCGDGVCDAAHGEAALTGCGADCPLCGDGVCQLGETDATCPGDCACRAACFIVGYGQDELGCPDGFAACRCGDHTCEPWERADGAAPCPGDCP